MANPIKNLVSLSSFLSSYELSDPNLAVCCPDGDSYSTLLFQPQEALTVNDQYIRCTSADFPRKCESFIETAIKEKVNLAIAPEYCFQWDFIVRLIDEDLFPEESNIFALGCESLTIDKLQQITKNTKTIWIYELDILTKSTEGNFLSPFCYLFQTRNPRGELCKVVVIQFKTAFMGGTTSFERGRLIRGKNIYYIKNSTGSSIRLASFLCSDVLDFNEDRTDETYSAPVSLYSSAA